MTDQQGMTAGMANIAVWLNGMGQVLTGLSVLITVGEFLYWVWKRYGGPVTYRSRIQVVVRLRPALRDHAYFELLSWYRDLGLGESQAHERSAGEAADVVNEVYHRIEHAPGRIRLPRPSRIRARLMRHVDEEIGRRMLTSFGEDVQLRLRRPGGGFLAGGADGR